MDPISNMLISIKNGSIAKKASVVVPFSKMKFAVAECLAKEGFVGEVSQKKQNDRPFLEITIKYTEGKAKVNGVKRLSKLSRRTYMGFKDIRPVKQGSGALILSTPKGILSGKQARKELVGGEALFEIW